jgi:hypothetical protein
MAELSRTPPSLGDYARAMEAGLWLMVAKALLTVFPIRWLLREVVRGEAERPPPAASAAVVERARTAMSAASSRLPWPRGCLPKSIAGALMCRVRGVRVPIAFSVTTHAGGLAAHAALDGGDDANSLRDKPAGRTHLARVRLFF